ncbi:SymE family type I addiction module toxin [Morganella morganii]|uniref:SymE family type I addiction module toxin n=1 Tax=Morganella TaxID=581 RepID=UPI00370A5723
MPCKPRCASLFKELFFCYTAAVNPVFPTCVFRFYPILISAITLKGHWLKAAGFETGFTFTVKILNGCLVLIPDSEDIWAIKQQNQQQQAQIAAFKLKVKALIGE